MQSSNGHCAALAWARALSPCDDKKPSAARAMPPKKRASAPVEEEQEDAEVLWSILIRGRFELTSTVSGPHAATDQALCGCPVHGYDWIPPQSHQGTITVMPASALSLTGPCLQGGGFFDKEGISEEGPDETALRRLQANAWAEGTTAATLRACS